MVSTKGRYALRVMADLAGHQADGYLPLAEVAQRQGISEKYLENIIKSLVQAKLLTGIRGKGGGYRLTKRPEEYTVGGILRAAEGDLAPVACLESGASPCPRQADCPTLGMWMRLDEVIRNFLDSVSLADLLTPPQNGD